MGNLLDSVDLANAQFIGFTYGKKYGNIIGLINEMGLTKHEWEVWKEHYCNVLDQLNFDEIDEYFKD